MIRTWTTFILAACITLAGACGDDDPAGDICEGVSDCTTAGTSCTGDTLVTCAANADGCLVESSTDCTASGNVCDDSGATAACTTTCTDDPECAGSTSGNISCFGNSLITCNTGAGGCLEATIQDCTATDAYCDADSAFPSCACDDHPSCAGKADGDTECDGFSLNACNTTAAGCLALTQTNCSPGLCNDGAAPVCDTVALSGADCANAIPVLASGFLFQNADITTFLDDFDVNDDGVCALGEPNGFEAVFSVDLLDGETVYVAELGGMDSVVNIQTTCGAQNCEAGQDDPDAAPQSYTAVGNETVFIVVESYSAAPDPTGFAVEVSIDPVCGNGVLEANEFCDDGGIATGDGCDDSCIPEFGWQCDVFSPSACSELPHLGSYAVGDVIPSVVRSSNLASGAVDGYLIEFTESVFLQGTLSAEGGADVDFSMYDMNFAQAHAAREVGNEVLSAQLIPAGTYAVYVNNAGATDAAQGYNLSMVIVDPEDAGTIGNGGSASFTGGALPAAASNFYSVTLSEDLLLNFTLTDMSAMSDIDLLIWGSEGLVSFNADQGGVAGVDIALLAGTYTFEVNAFEGAEDSAGYTLAFTAATLAVNDIGTFAPAGAIADVDGPAFNAGQYDHHTITFSADVLLSGTLAVDSTGDIGIRLYDAEQGYLHSFSSGNDTWTDEPIAAGTYVVQILSLTSGGNIDGYTLTFATTAP